MKKLKNLLLPALTALFAVGCSTPWAPVPEGKRENRLKFYETNHWPYAQELPPIKVPAQMASGVPALPAIIVMTPFTFFFSEEPTYDFGMAIIESERMYMEYPGYAIYRAVGYPMYILKEGAVFGGNSIYSAFSSDDEEGEDVSNDATATKAEETTAPQPDNAQTSSVQDVMAGDQSK